jgi:hypothetical protein
MISDQFLRVVELRGEEEEGGVAPGVSAGGGKERAVGVGKERVAVRLTFLVGKWRALSSAGS